nr:hypothetical protein Iba_chr13cCG16120 [Ipomoea batatas]
MSRSLLSLLPSPKEEKGRRKCCFLPACSIFLRRLPLLVAELRTSPPTPLVGATVRYWRIPSFSSANLDFSTSSLSEAYDSSTTRLTSVENSTVFCHNSAAIPPLPQTQFFLAVRFSYSVES